METINQKLVFEHAMQIFGVVPGIVKELAERSPQAAYVFTEANRIMEGASFNSLEINAIELKISVLNKCTSCIKGHSYLLKKEGMNEEDIKSIIANGNPQSERLRTLLEATENIYYAGSDIYPAQVRDALQENLSDREITEIIALIGIKTIANYQNNYLESLKNK
ncbi:MAG: carboxymuconolactone decarboxylase family protein [Bacteroidia bacterium]|nr:carboxymuconolactone decarboxylase family protein [Bacteroidia bacterium]